MLKFREIKGAVAVMGVPNGFEVKEKKVWGKTGKAESV